MIPRFLMSMFLVSVLMVAPGCTHRACYDGMRESRRQECYNLSSDREVRDCLAEVEAGTYDRYEEQRGEMNETSE